MRCSEVSLEEAEEAVRNNRVIIAYFYFSDEGWDCFSDFFTDEDTKYDYLKMKKKHYGDQGHGVVITGQTSKYWKMRNSWGEKWGDGGYFRLAKSVKMKFIDVYFLEEDLTQEDRNNFKWSRTN